MNIEAEKIRLVKLLLDTENPRVLASIKKIFAKEKTSDFWDELSVSQKEEIEKASFEIKNGEVVDYESFIQKYR